MANMKKKIKFGKFDEMWIPIPIENPDEFYSDWLETNDQVWELIVKYNKMKNNKIF